MSLRDVDNGAYQLSDCVAPACPVCDGMAVALGTLGFLDHWNCRNCGAQWATDNRLNDGEQA